jgi:hypothetical protein
MNASIRRLAGIILALFSAASLVVTIFLLVNIWQARTKLEGQLVKGINQVQVSIEIASSGLVATQEVLSDTQQILDGIVEMMLSMTASVHEVPPVLRSLEDLSGKDLPATISSTQLSLTAAQDSAGRIEDMLALVSQIPFFPGGKYEPEVTLKDALGNVSEDLDGIRQPLRNMERGIRSTRANLERLEGEGAAVTLDVRTVARDLEKAGESLADSLEQIEALDRQLQILEGKIPGWLASAVWVVTFFLVWIGLAQINWLIEAVRDLRT